MLDVRRLTCRQPGIPPAIEVTLEARVGELTTLVGENGAGKTTICLCLAGLLPIDSGDILVDGRRVTPGARDAVEAGLAVVPEGRRTFPEMTVLDNLLVAPTRTQTRTVAARLESVFRLFPVLHERQRQTAGTLSGGEQQMVAIGRAMMSEPRVLVLDEPGQGLSPRVLSELYRALAALSASGRAVLVAEEDRKHAGFQSGRMYLMDRGRVGEPAPVQRAV